MFSPDNEKITEAIVNLEVSALAREAGANLVDSWIAHNTDDQKLKIVGVECGWALQLAPETWAIGVMDLVAEDDNGIFGFEFKTTKEPSKWWNEEKWLSSITNGPQLGIYSCALAEATFYEKHEDGRVIVFKPSVSSPRIRVRAAVKTAVPRFWPSNAADGLVTFSEEAMQATKNAFIVKANAIRQARKSGLVPWQLPGPHCTTFNRQCGYWDDCTEHRHQPLAITSGFDGSDPAATLALPHITRTPDTIVLSASAYSTYSECLEKGRLDSMTENKEESLALDTGTTLHAGLACYHKQLRDYQQEQR